MRGYVEMKERLEFNMPEGRNATPEEVCGAMADRLAARDDAAKDARRDAMCDRDQGER